MHPSSSSAQAPHLPSTSQALKKVADLTAVARRLRDARGHASRRGDNLRAASYTRQIEAVNMELTQWKHLSTSTSTSSSTSSSTSTSTSKPSTSTSTSTSKIMYLVLIVTMLGMLSPLVNDDARARGISHLVVATAVIVGCMCVVDDRHVPKEPREEDTKEKEQVYGKQMVPVPWTKVIANETAVGRSKLQGRGDMMFSNLESVQRRNPLKMAPRASY